MKRLLIISYYWPPCGGPGSLRPVKFAKYLPEFGIEPIILTRKEIAYHSIDPELGGDLKDLQIYRTESFDPARILYCLGMREYRPKGWHVPIKKGLNFPDNKLGWLPFAYETGLKIDFDYLFVTGPPFSSFITGYLLAKKKKKPLVLDFRDAWLEFPFTPYENKIQRRFVSYWEERVVRSASLVITVSEDIKKSLCHRYPEVTEKIFIIPNGYDPDDFPVHPFPEKFTIAYLGTIRRERNPTPFLKAVEQFLKETDISSDSIVVKFIGHIEDEYLKMIKKYPFTKTFGHLPYQKAISEFCHAHLALMITTGDEFFFPSRQIEYLASGLPIICCGYSKGVALLKEARDHGYPVKFFAYDGILEIKGEILDYYVKYKSNRLKRVPYMVPQYTRRNLTKRLVELIQRHLK